MPRSRDFVSRFILKGDDESARAFSQFERSVGGLITRFAAFAGVGLSLDAVIDKTRQAVKEFDNIAKTADKIGVSTGALQELRHAAELTGVQTNTLDMALQRFVRRTAEAAEGTGEAKAVLEEMGIQLRDNDGRLRSADDLLKDVADKLAAVEDQGERVRIAFKLFDSEGVAFVNTLQRGSGALEAMRREARELGIVIDERVLRESERMNDELTRASDIIDKNLKLAFLNLAPAMVAATRAMADFTTEVSAFFEGFERLDQISDTGLDRQIERAERRMAKFREEVDKSRDSFFGLLRPSLVVATTVAALQTDIEDLQTEKVRRDLLEAFEAVEPQVQRVRDIIGGIRLDLNFFDDASEAVRRLFAADAPALPRPKPEFEVDEREQKLREAREKARIEAHRSDVDRIRERSEVFRAAQEGEIGMLRFRAAEEHEILREALDAKAIELEEFNAVRLRIEQDFHDQVRALEEERERRAKAWFELQRDIAIMNAADIVSTFGKHFKELYFLQQASAVTNTVMRTIESVQAALTVPPPAGYVFAAINAAAGAANVASIMATTFGSKSAKPNTGKGGGGAPSRAAAQALPPSTDTPRTPTVITLRLEGGRNRRYTFDEVVDMMEGFNEALGDGHKLHVTTG